MDIYLQRVWDEGEPIHMGPVTLNDKVFHENFKKIRNRSITDTKTFSENKIANQFRSILVEEQDQFIPEVFKVYRSLSQEQIEVLGARAITGMNLIIAHPQYAERRSETSYYWVEKNMAKHNAQYNEGIRAIKKPSKLRWYWSCDDLCMDPSNPCPPVRKHKRKSILKQRKDCVNTYLYQTEQIIHREDMYEPEHSRQLLSPTLRNAHIESYNKNRTLSLINSLGWKPDQVEGFLSPKWWNNLRERGKKQPREEWLKACSRSNSYSLKYTGRRWLDPDPNDLNLLEENDNASFLVVNDGYETTWHKVLVSGEEAQQLKRDRKVTEQQDMLRRVRQFYGFSEKTVSVQSQPTFNNTNAHDCRRDQSKALVEQVIVPEQLWQKAHVQNPVSNSAQNQRYEPVKVTKPKNSQIQRPDTNAVRYTHDPSPVYKAPTVDNASQQSTKTAPKVNPSQGFSQVHDSPEPHHKLAIPQTTVDWEYLLDKYFPKPKDKPQEKEKPRTEDDSVSEKEIYYNDPPYEAEFGEKRKIAPEYIPEPVPKPVLDPPCPVNTSQNNSSHNNSMVNIQSNAPDNYSNNENFYNDNRVAPENHGPSTSNAGNHKVNKPANTRSKSSANKSNGYKPGKPKTQPRRSSRNRKSVNPALNSITGQRPTEPSPKQVNVFKPDKKISQEVKTFIQNLGRNRMKPDWARNIPWEDKKKGGKTKLEQYFDKSTDKFEKQTFSNALGIKKIHHLHPSKIDLKNPAQSLGKWLEYICRKPEYHHLIKYGLITDNEEKIKLDPALRINKIQIKPSNKVKIGLQNEGNCCYAISTIQALLPMVKGTFGHSALDELYKAYFEKDTEKANANLEFVLDEINHVKQLKSINTQYGKGRFHDLVEFLGDFLDTYEDHLDLFSEYKYDACYKAVGGAISSGGLYSDNEFRKTLNLEASSEVNTQLATDELIRTGYDVYAEAGKVFVEEASDFLIVTISYTADERIEVSKNLHLKMYTGNLTSYELKSIACHEGSEKSGHYTCMRKIGNRIWHFNDGLVVEVREKKWDSYRKGEGDKRPVLALYQVQKKVKEEDKNSSSDSEEENEYIKNDKKPNPVNDIEEETSVKPSDVTEKPVKPSYKDVVEKTSKTTKKKKVKEVKEKKTDKSKDNPIMQLAKSDPRTDMSELTVRRGIMNGNNICYCISTFQALKTVLRESDKMEKNPFNDLLYAYLESTDKQQISHLAGELCRDLNSKHGRDYNNGLGNSSIGFFRDCMNSYSDSGSFADIELELSVKKWKSAEEPKRIKRKWLQMTLSKDTVSVQNWLDGTRLTSSDKNQSTILEMKNFVNVKEYIIIEVEDTDRKNPIEINQVINISEKGVKSDFALVSAVFHNSKGDGHFFTIRRESPYVKFHEYNDFYLKEVEDSDLPKLLDGQKAPQLAIYQRVNKSLVRGITAKPAPSEIRVHTISTAKGDESKWEKVQTKGKDSSDVKMPSAESNPDKPSSIPTNPQIWKPEMTSLIEEIPETTNDDTWWEKPEDESLKVPEKSTKKQNPRNSPLPQRQKEEPEFSQVFPRIQVKAPRTKAAQAQRDKKIRRLENLIDSFRRSRDFRFRRAPIVREPVVLVESVTIPPWGREQVMMKVETSGNAFHHLNELSPETDWCAEMSYIFKDGSSRLITNSTKNEITLPIGTVVGMAERLDFRKFPRIIRNHEEGYDEYEIEESKRLARRRKALLDAGVDTKVINEEEIGDWPDGTKELMDMLDGKLPPPILTGPKNKRPKGKVIKVMNISEDSEVIFHKKDQDETPRWYINVLRNPDNFDVAHLQKVSDDMKRELVDAKALADPSIKPEPKIPNEEESRDISKLEIECKKSETDNTTTYAIRVLSRDNSRITLTDPTFNQLKEGIVKALQEKRTIGCGEASDDELPSSSDSENDSADDSDKASDLDEKPSEKSRRIFKEKMEETYEPLANVLRECESLFIKEDPGEPFTYSNLPPVAYQVNEDCPKILKCQYKKSFTSEPKKQQYLDCWLRTQLDSGMIRRSESTITSPIMMVPKRDIFRVVIDVRQVNKRCLKPVNKVMPSTEEYWRKIAHYKIFSTIDVSSAYHRAPLIPAHYKFTAFEICEGPMAGTYEYMSLGQGISQSGALFMELMGDLFAGLPGATGHLGDREDGLAKPYLDDIIVGSNSLEEHVVDMKRVMGRLMNANLKLDISKSLFGRTNVEFLGLTVGNGEIKTTPSRTDKLDEVLLRLPTLGTKGENKWAKFFGPFSYYRRFIPNYSKIESEIKEHNETCKEDKCKILRAKLQERCQKLAEGMVKSIRTQILHAPPPLTDLVIKADASIKAIGYTLETNDKDRRPIAFGGKILSKDEYKRMTVFEKELYALSLAVTKFEPYLRRAKSTRILSDNLAVVINNVHMTPITMSLCAIKHLQNIQNRIAGLEVTFDHISGLVNVMADEISRLDTNEKRINFMDVGIRTRSHQTIYDQLKAIHMVGHAGIKRMIKSCNENGIKTTNVVRGLIDDVIEDCEFCRVEKRLLCENVIGMTKTQEKELVEIHLDHLEFNLRTSANNKYVFTIIDSFSNLSWAFPVASKSPTEAAKYLKGVLTTHPTITDVLADNAFRCTEFNDIAENMSIRFRYTSSHNSKENSVERFHGYIRDKLPAYEPGKTTPAGDWEYALSDVVKGYNRTPCTVTGFSPRYVCFSALPETLLDTDPRYLLSKRRMRQLVYQRIIKSKNKYVNLPAHVPIVKKGVELTVRYHDRAIPFKVIADEDLGLNVRATRKDYEGPKKTISFHKTHLYKVRAEDTENNVGIDGEDLKQRQAIFLLRCLEANQTDPEQVEPKKINIIEVPTKEEREECRTNVKTDVSRTGIKIPEETEVILGPEFYDRYFYHPMGVEETIHRYSKYKYVDMIPVHPNANVGRHPSHYSLQDWMKGSHDTRPGGIKRGHTVCVGVPFLDNIVRFQTAYSGLGNELVLNEWLNLQDINTLDVPYVLMAATFRTLNKDLKLDKDLVAIKREVQYEDFYEYKIVNGKSQKGDKISAADLHSYLEHHRHFETAVYAKSEIHNIRKIEADKHDINWDLKDSFSFTEANSSRELISHKTGFYEEGVYVMNSNNQADNIHADKSIVMNFILKLISKIRKLTKGISLFYLIPIIMVIILRINCTVN